MRALAAAALALAAAPAMAEDAGPLLLLRFSCEDGRAVEAAFLHLGGTDVALLAVDAAAPVLLTLAPSASGARYTGAGLEWWGKGQEEATLSPLADGADLAAAPGVACRALP